MTDQTAEAVLSDADLKRLHGLAYNAVGSVDVSVIQPALRTLLADRERLRTRLTTLADDWKRRGIVRASKATRIAFSNAAGELLATLNTQGEGK